MKDALITLPDGRHLAYTDIGDTAGAPVLFFHGAPDCRLSLVLLEPEFAARGLRVISPDRPGYGRSSPQPRRLLSDWPKDIAAAADALGLDRFMVVSYSSGGPYGVACAALIPERVSGAIVLSGITDMTWPGAWDGLFAPELEMMRLPDEDSVKSRCAELFGADGNGFLTHFELGEADMALLANEDVAREVQATFTEAFRQGVLGYAQDVSVQGRPWPFACDAITAPVIVAHGDLDTVVPVAHSRHTAAMIPGAVLRVLPGHGHLTILLELPGLCADLVRSHGFG